YLCFPTLRYQKEKTSQRTEPSSLVPDQDRRFTSPGPRALKSCPLLLGPWRKVWDGINAEDTFTNDLRPVCVCVCVSCVASMNSRVVQCVVCAIKNKTKDKDKGLNY